MHAAPNTELFMDHRHQEQNEKNAKKKRGGSKLPRIAIISSHIPSSQAKDSSRIQLLDHLVNKVCYAHLWNYDFIFNMTPGFNNEDIDKAPWLEFGTWHRVPHISSRIGDYDWILYADIDYVFTDMSRPLESFLKEFELYGKDPSVFLPLDQRPSKFMFSAFAVMLKNSVFGSAVLENWMDFGRGLCPNGNFPREELNGKLKYDWKHSDQPGIWYSLVKTHMDFFQAQKDGTVTHWCNEATGFVNSTWGFAPEINSYFKKINAKTGSDGKSLRDVPDAQPIIWSTSNMERGTPYNGLGYQMKFGKRPNDTEALMAFALHKAKEMPDFFHMELDICKRIHGCYANYTDDGILQIGCNGIQYPVATG
eukprot:CAMPEP_0198291756 /NCGR_PEP_ID=MMETSP1449-20131203/9178_1 /TAXON_ID=420275 /ORGANISM="Attheya septentrionalis, Strain CCMP2084" /LENGTH=364 /DNA_ID=CAMNT_0043990437 /DNA_START=395 /DNA_END=1492 /DNA_ORIENTATION=-